MHDQLFFVGALKQINIVRGAKYAEVKFIIKKDLVIFHHERSLCRRRWRFFLNKLRKHSPVVGASAISCARKTSRSSGA